MKTFFISYDLGVPETRSEYTALADHIKMISVRWARPVKSVWIIKTDMSAGQIRDAIKIKLDSNDKLIVVEMSRDWGTFNIPKEVTDWMKLNIQ